MKFVIALLIMILALSSCVEEKREQRKYMDILTININPHKKQVVHPFDSLFKKINVVKLETTNESLIGRIDKMVLYEDNIYILDQKQKKIFVFDRRGCFQKVINHFGQGEGEYASLVDFQIKDDQIYLLDRYGSKLFVYDLNDHLIKIEKVRKSKSVAVLNEGYAYNLEFGFADNESKKNYYSYCYEDSKKENFQNPFNKNLLGLSFSLNEGHNTFYNRGGSLNTLFPFNDTIYTVTPKGKIEPFQVFKIGDMTIGKDDNPNEIRRMLDNGISRSIFAYYNFQNYSFFSYYYGDESRKYVLVDKMGNVIFNTDLGLDIDGIPIRIISYDTDKNDNAIISMLYPFELFACYKRDEDNEYFKTLLEGVNQDSNPILVFYSFEPKFMDS